MLPDLKHWAWRGGLAVCLIALVGAIFSREIAFFVAPDPRVILEVRDDIRTVEDLRLWPQAYGTFGNEGFVPCLSGAWAESGWCLPPGGKGVLRYTLPLLPESRGLLLRLFFFHRSSEARNRLLVYREGEATPRLTFEDVYFADAHLDLSQALKGQRGRVVLSFEGDNPTLVPDVTLSHLEVRFFSDPIPVAPSLHKMTLAVLMLGLTLLPLGSWRRLIPLWAIFSLGFALRYYALTHVLFLPPDFDALGYHQLARKMALFTDTGFYSAQFGNREPLHILIVKGMLWLLGDSETHVRLVSFFASLLVIVLTYRLAAKLFGVPLGLLGALLIALNLPLARESVRGLRLEIELVLLLVFVEVAFVMRARSPWRRAGAMGLLGGSLGLLRNNYVMNLLPLFFLSAWSFGKRRTLFAAGLGVLLMVGLVFPHRWNGYRLYGDMFWDQNARWNANVEFAGKLGWPSKQEMWRNTEGIGPRMSYFEYFFRLHTVPEFIVGSAGGLWKVVRHMDVIAFHRGVARIIGFDLAFVDLGFQFAGIVGLVLAAFNPAFRWMPFTFLLLLGHVTFLYDRGSVEPWRHTYHALPMILFGALLALSTALRLGADFVQGSSPLWHRLRRPLLRAMTKDTR